MPVNALVIDDSRTAADFLMFVLRRLDIDTRVAYGPSPAMSILKTDTPDVVFLDINMPGLSGFDVLSYMSREPRLMFVPVFVVTADEHPETTKQAIAAGARGVFLKPITFEAIEPVLRQEKVI